MMLRLTQSATRYCPHSEEKPVNHSSRIRIHPSAEVSPDAQVGEGTVIWNNVQVRENAVIGRDCSLGKDVYIDNGAIVGNGVKFQNCVNVCVGVTIEDDVLVTANGHRVLGKKIPKTINEVEDMSSR